MIKKNTTITPTEEPIASTSIEVNSTKMENMPIEQLEVAQAIEDMSKQMDEQIHKLQDVLNQVIFSVNNNNKNLNQLHVWNTWTCPS